MRTVPAPPDDVFWLADALARIVTAKEALEDGATEYAWQVLHDLELDLAAYQARGETK